MPGNWVFGLTDTARPRREAAAGRAHPGDGVAPGMADSGDVDNGRLLADQISAIQRTLVPTVAGNLLLGLLVGWALHRHVPSAGLAAWLVLLAVHCAFNIWTIRAARNRPVTPRNASRRAAAAVRSAAALGIIWAGGILALWPEGPEALPERFLLAFLVAGVSSGALHSLSAHLPTFTAFFVPTVAAVALSSLLEGGKVFLSMAGITVVYGVVTWRYAQSLNQTLIEAIRRRHQLEALAHRLTDQIRLSERAQRARSRLLAAASHDLRQPVHALALLLGVAADDASTPAQHRRMGLARQATDGLAAQLDALLDLARLDAGVLKAEPRLTALHPLVGAVVDAMRPSAEARGLALRFRAAHITALTDPLILERMLRNLLSNAIRYTDRGGVLVALRPARRGGATLDIVDTGIGIPPEQQTQVFDEFVQGAGAAGRGGLGLGLSIVRGCAELLGHGLSLRSTSGRGSRFTIAFTPDQAVVVERTAPPEHASDAQAPTRPVAGPHAEQVLGGRIVVLIEDDEAVCLATSELLSAWGATVVAGATIDAVLHQLVAVVGVPALVIADGRLADGASGIDALRRIHDEYNDETIPAIVISADPDVLAAAQAAGLSTGRKPIDAGRLATCVQAALQLPDHRG